MKQLRLLVLVLALLGVLVGYYYQRGRAVNVETVSFESKVTGKSLPYTVVLPPGYGFITKRTTRYPVLYLLHGWNENHSSWLSQTALTRYAADYQIIIITPEGENGWYTDSATVDTDKYETYVTQELIPDVQSRYRTLPERAARAIAGNSMGGYGALKFGLKYPDLFVLAASFSGALDAATRTDEASIMQTFGSADSPVREANNITKLARYYPESDLTALPYFYLDCGTADAWLNPNRELATIFAERGIRHQYRQLEGGHDWSYWDRQLNELLRLAANMLSAPS